MAEPASFSSLPSHEAPASHLLNRIPIRGMDEPAVRPRALSSARVDVVCAAALGLACLALYLKTAAPGVYSFDAAELSIAAATWGIPHATGYPLFLLLGRLFITALPVGDVAWRMVVGTAVFAALTPATLFLILRELRLDWRACLLASAAFAISYYQWASAVVTKEHSLHDWLLALVLLFLLRWQQRRTFGWLLAATAIYGLSLTNHLAAALYAPALLGFVGWTEFKGKGQEARGPADSSLDARNDKRGGIQNTEYRTQNASPLVSGDSSLYAQNDKRGADRNDRRLGPSRWLLVVGAFLVSLAPYAYLPLVSLRNPAFNIAGQFDAAGVFHPVNLASAQGMLWMLSARQFAGAVAGTGLAELPGQLWGLGQWLWGNFFGLGVVLGVAGLKSFHDRNRAFFWMAAGVAALHTAFFVRYGVGDRDSMFVPLYLLWAIALGFGIEWALAQLSSRRWQDAASALLAIGIVGGAAANYGLLDLSGDQRPRDWAVSLLDKVPPDATVLTRWAFPGPLRYEQLIDGRRPDVQVIDAFLIRPADLAQFVQQNVGRRTLVVDDVSLLPAGDYPGICGSALPGVEVNLEKFPINGPQPASYAGYRLVRCAS